MNVIKIILIGLLVFLLILAAIEFLADVVFDDSASIDVCLDGGGAWHYEKEKCVYH